MNGRSSTLRPNVARAFKPLLSPARYKGAWGGRGSGKSHFFAESLIANAVRYRGFRAVCIREVQKTLAQSAKKLIEDKIQRYELEPYGFRILQDRIVTPADGLIIFQGMQDHTADSIKSLESFNVAWVEEAQTLSQISLDLLRPTIRAEDSELWFSWNPRRKNDPVDVMLRQGELPTNSMVVRANWSDNPWFPDVLEQERKDCLEREPEKYEHIWEGGYATITEGAYYAQKLAQARTENRIGKVAADPLLPLKAFIDIGGTGAKSDAFAMWIAQFIGQEIRLLDYYESQGQPLECHVAWLRSKGYDPHIYLPHDGATFDRVYAVSYESAFKTAGYSATVVPNQGKGAASKRIEEARRLFPQMWFDEKCAPGMEALGWYHERRDENRNIGLGPEHDWSSHAADAFGLMAVVHEPPTKPYEEPPKQLFHESGGWMR